MKQGEDQIKRIQEKIQQLLRQHAVLQKENQQLKDELGGLRTQNASQEENLATLKQQVDVLKYSSATMNEEEKKQFERRLTVYVKEIDKCIAMLSA